MRIKRKNNRTRQSVDEGPKDHLLREGGYERGAFRSRARQSVDEGPKDHLLCEGGYERKVAALARA
jgi:hypothetical protein